MISEYSQWFFNDGWLVISIFGFVFGGTIGLRAYWLIGPAVLIAIAGKF